MKVAFAQLINDGSEIKMRVLEAKAPQDNMDVEGTPGALTLELPVQKPPVDVPVVELFLKT